MLIASLLMFCVQAPTYDRLLPVDSGYVVQVEVDGKPKLAGINLGSKNSFLIQEELELGEIPPGVECQVRFRESSTMLSKVKFSRSTFQKYGAKQQNGYDLILGADAFRDKVFVWNIPKECLMISEVSVPGRNDIPFSKNGLTFKLSGDKFELPTTHKVNVRSSRLRKISGFKRDDPKAYTDAPNDSFFYTDSSDRLRLTGIVQNIEISGERTGESFFGFQVVEVDFKSNSIRFDQNYVFNFVYFLRTETNQDIRFENGKFMFYKATAEIPKINSDHWGVESAEVVEIGGINLREAFSERIEGARKILESLWYREPSFLLKTNGETKKYLLKNFGS